MVRRMMTASSKVCKGFLHYLYEHRFTALALCDEERNVAALTNLGHHEVHCFHPGIQTARTITAAVSAPAVRALTFLCTQLLIDLGLHEVCTQPFQYTQHRIRPLTSQESYDLLEIAEARSSRSTIFCTQYQPEGWYTRIDPDPESQSPISEAIMDRIIHNSYEIMVEGRISMRERKGLRAASLKDNKTDA